jgi:hypothetical protein
MFRFRLELGLLRVRARVGVRTSFWFISVRFVVRLMVLCRFVFWLYFEWLRVRIRVRVRILFQIVVMIQIWIRLGSDWVYVNFRFRVSISFRVRIPKG